MSATTMLSLPLTTIRRSRAFYRWRSRINRWRLAWRYATGNLTEDDAYTLSWESHDITGCYPLEWVSVEGVLESALCNWEDHPRLREYAEQAARRVYSKWDSSGHVTDAAHDWAVDLIREYAADDGVELTEY